MKKTKTEKALSKAGKEMKKKEPATIAKTRRKKGKAAAEAQRVAILLSKAREEGADIPKKKRKGPTYS